MYVFLPGIWLIYIYVTVLPMYMYTCIYMLLHVFSYILPIFMVTNTKLHIHYATVKPFTTQTCARILL